jgi:hypothetical protein
MVLSRAITSLASGPERCGNVDLAALDSRNSAVLVFFNNWNRTFGNPLQIPVSPSNAASLTGGGFAIADTNGDGKPDIVSVARSANAGTTVLIQQTLLNAGNGTFQPSTQVTSTLPGTFSLTVGKAFRLPI